MLILLIRRIYCNAGIAQHGLGTGRRDDELLIGVLDRVADIPEGAGDVLILDLGIGQRGAAVRTPVDDAAALVDKPFLIEVAEGLAHSLGADLVHREAAAAPVAGDAHALLLLDYTVAVLLLPVPDALKELVAAEIVAGLALLLAQHLFDLYLGRDAGMVNAGQPQRGIALHSLITGQDILKCRIKGMPHVELTGDIGWRHNDGERLLIGVYLALEIVPVHPHLIDLFLDRFRVIHFRKFFHSLLSSHIEKRPEAHSFRAINYRGTT